MKKIAFIGSLGYAGKHLVAELVHVCDLAPRQTVTSVFLKGVT